MHQILGVILALGMCGTATAAAPAPPSNELLEEAQTAFVEASRLQKSGQYSDAITRAEHSLKYREAILGPSHRKVADCLHLLGELFLQQGDASRAEPAIRRAIDIREALLGKLHPDVAQSINNLGLCHTARGQYSRAESLFERARFIAEAALGKSHPDVASILDNLGTNYRAQGLYARAEPLHERAIAIREAALGKFHLDVALSINNLAVILEDQGQGTRAEPLYERALAIQETVHGKSHPNVALALNNLAFRYKQQGQYALAKSLYERALVIWERALGKSHPDVAEALSNLAGLYRTQGDYARAEPLYQRALAIWEATLGTSHPDVAMSINNLASFYKAQGQSARAEPLYQRALAIWEATLGTSHPAAAYLLDNLATLQMERGRYARAKEFYTRALTTREAALGTSHPIIGQSLTNLARLHLAQHRADRAIPLLRRAFTISEQRLRREALGLSGTRLTNFLQNIHAEEDLLYALLRAHPNNHDAQQLALSSTLLRKGRSVDEVANTSRTVYRNLDAEGRILFEKLLGLRTQLAHLSLRGPGASPFKDYQDQLNALSEQGDLLETNLARHSAPLRALTALPSSEAIIQRVAGTLPRRSALIEFIVYADRSFVFKTSTISSHRPSQLRYLAIILFPDSSIRALDLGPAAPIDEAASDLRAALARRDASYLRSAQRLYTRALMPLLPLLRGAHRLFIAPDGQLSLIPFDTLHDGRHFLIDNFEISYVTSGKDLLASPEHSSRESQAVVVFADPTFDIALDASASSDRSPQPAQVNPLTNHFFSTLRTSLVNQSWPALPGTRQEAQAIQRLLPQAQLFLGANATKQKLLQLSAPSILHIATHGFFREDVSTIDSSRAIAQIGSMGDSAPTFLPADPLLRSGLALAGVRAASSKNIPTISARVEDSLVTSLEFSGLNLWGTQLVVLSACDTGRGDVKLGQGVYGLRRAFVIAGAETIVMSLWKVNDESTRLLMEIYYRYLLIGKGRAEALRDAMRQLRTTHPHPHYWAPFIALGSDAPLQRFTAIPQRPEDQSERNSGAGEAEHPSQE